jgi:hypothetical protein
MYMYRKEDRLKKCFHLNYAILQMKIFAQDRGIYKKITTDIWLLFYGLFF